MGWTVKRIRQRRQWENVYAAGTTLQQVARSVKRHHWHTGVTSANKRFPRSVVLPVGSKQARCARGRVRENQTSEVLKPRRSPPKPASPPLKPKSTASSTPFLA